jgi:hypothetical protein
MDTKPQPTDQQERGERYRQHLLDYVKSLPEGELVEESAISVATEALGHKVPKMFIRSILKAVDGIDKDQLEAGKVCRIGPVDAGSGPS